MIGHCRDIWWLGSYRDSMIGQYRDLWRLDIIGIFDDWIL